MTGGPLLAIDTATTRAVIALAEAGAAPRVLRADAWAAGYRHGEELLARIEGLLAGAGVAPAELGGIVVGTGPGAFTGLRVGVATAKGLAHALRLPIVGVATSDALLDAVRAAEAGPAAPGTVLLLPAGPSDRVACRAGEPATIVPGGHEPELRPGDRLVAVDLAGRAPDDAVARGERARDGLAEALVRLGGSRLVRGDVDDLARLEPEYVTIPRGVARPVGDEAVVVAARGARRPAAASPDASP